MCILGQEIEETMWIPAAFSNRFSCPQILLNFHSSALLSHSNVLGRDHARATWVIESSMELLFT